MKAFKLIGTLAIGIFLGITIAVHVLLPLVPPEVVYLEPEPELLWADMNVAMMEELALNYFPEHDPMDIEFTWRMADVMGATRSYWVLQPVEGVE